MQLLPLRVPLLLPEREGVPLAVAQADNVALGQRVTLALPQREGDGEGVMLVLVQPLPLPLREVLPVLEAQPERDGVPLTVAHVVEEAEWQRLTLALPQREGEVEGVLLLLTQPLPLLLREVLPVLEAQPLPVPLREPLALEEAQALPLPLRVPLVLLEMQPLPLTVLLLL